MMLSQIIAQTQLPHHPIKIDLFTWANVVLFIKYFWLVNRALWPVWALLGFFGLVKIGWAAMTRPKRAAARLRPGELGR